MSQLHAQASVSQAQGLAVGQGHELRAEAPSSHCIASSVCRSHGAWRHRQGCGEQRGCGKKLAHSKDTFSGCRQDVFGVKGERGGTRPEAGLGCLLELENNQEIVTLQLSNC